MGLSFLTIYIRASQIYLDYAEALFEGCGSATATIEGCPISAAEAINILRRRIGLTDLPSDIVADLINSVQLIAVSVP